MNIFRRFQPVLGSDALNGLAGRPDEHAEHHAGRIKAYLLKRRKRGQRRIWWVFEKQNKKLFQKIFLKKQKSMCLIRRTTLYFISRKKVKNKKNVIGMDFHSFSLIPYYSIS